MNQSISLYSKILRRPELLLLLLLFPLLLSTPYPIRAAFARS